jgi:hypothetical protein
LFLAHLAHDHGELSAEANGYPHASVQFPGFPSHTIIRCTEDYNNDQWYDFVAVKVYNSALPANVVDT